MFVARRIEGAAPFWAAEAAKQLVIRASKAQENERSHTDGISPSLAAEGVLHE